MAGQKAAKVPPIFGLSVGNVRERASPAATESAAGGVIGTSRPTAANPEIKAPWVCSGQGFTRNEVRLPEVLRVKLHSLLNLLLS